MIPTKALLDSMAVSLSTDAAFLAEVALVEVILLKAPFVPLPSTLIADLTLADFDGYAAIPVSSATAQVFTDPNTGEQIIQLVEPAGGWHWETTGNTNLPQTIYGFGVTNDAGTDLWGSDLLPAPIILTAAAQGVDIDQVRFRLSASALT